MALDAIKHIVVLMLENRSFDNVLAWLYERDEPDYFVPPLLGARYAGLQGKDLTSYKNPVTLPNGLQRDFYPIRRASTHPPYWNAPKPDPGEEFEHVTRQFFLDEEPIGKPGMNGFAQDYAEVNGCTTMDVPLIQQVMETYTPDQLPVLNGLAKKYAVSDYWFASVPTQTNPNRAFMACGTSLGQINNQGYWAYGDFKTDTIWNRLDQITGASWRIFWQETFVPVKDDNPPFTDQRGWTQKAFPRVRIDRFSPISEFHRQARLGTLPAFSFIEPSWSLERDFPEFGQQGLQGDDMHPPGDVRPAEDTVAQIYSSLIANP
ncbi:MAG: alkaline phosphatase family protein, partial [Chloroflexota bacterium]